MSDEPIISWKVAGIMLGLLLTLATFLVKPLGVSTQFVVTDAMVAHQVAPEFAEENTYLARYGKPSDWGVGYGWMLVFGMLVGGGLTAARFRQRQPMLDQVSMPSMWVKQFGASRMKRFATAFAGGVLLRDASGAVVGAVGVSGDTSDKDEVAAIAGVEAAGLVADANP